LTRKTSARRAAGIQVLLKHPHFRSKGVPRRHIRLRSQSHLRPPRHPSVQGRTARSVGCCRSGKVRRLPPSRCPPAWPTPRRGLRSPRTRHIHEGSTERFGPTGKICPLQSARKRRFNRLGLWLQELAVLRHGNAQKSRSPKTFLNDGPIVGAKIGRRKWGPRRELRPSGRSGRRLCGTVLSQDCQLLVQKSGNLRDGVWAMPSPCKSGENPDDQSRNSESCENCASSFWGIPPQPLKTEKPSVVTFWGRLG
jgi:hypothetical protein